MPPLRTIASGTCRVGDMWTDRLYRRREAFRLLRNAGAEVKADIGKSQFRQLLEIGVLGLKGYRAADYYQHELYKDDARAKKFMTTGEYTRNRSRLNKKSATSSGGQERCRKE